MYLPCDGDYVELADGRRGWVDSGSDKTQTANIELAWPNEGCALNVPYKKLKRVAQMRVRLREIEKSKI